MNYMNNASHNHYKLLLECYLVWQHPAERKSHMTIIYNHLHNE